MGCTLRNTDLPKPAGVSVNGVAIPRDAIAREVQHHPAPSPVAAWRAAAQALVIRELLVQAARDRGVVPRPIIDGEGRRETVEEALIRALVEQDVKTPEPDAETCRRYFTQNRRRFPADATYEAVADHIAAYLRDCVEHRAAAQYIARLISQARIEGIDLPGAEALRVH